MIIKSSEAAILVKSKQSLVFAQIKLPRDLETHQVLVEMITSGVCGAQINEIDAIKGPDRFLPHLLGHEGFAKVLEIGPEVTKISPGDYVVLHWRPSAGVQSRTPKYIWNNKVVNAGWVTTFNRHSVVSENRLTKVLPTYGRTLLPLLGCALTTAYGVLKYEAPVSMNSHVLILGIGGVGNAILQLCRIYGVKNLTVVETNKNKNVPSLIGTETNFIYHSNKTDTLEQIARISKDISEPNIAIDTTGNNAAIEIAYEASSSTAKIVLVGVPNLENKVSIYTLPLHFGKILTGSKGGSSIPDIDIPEILSMVDQEKIKEKSFPTVSYDFESINDAINDLRNSVNWRPIIRFNNG